MYCFADVLYENANNKIYSGRNWQKLASATPVLSVLNCCSGAFGKNVPNLAKVD